MVTATLLSAEHRNSNVRIALSGKGLMVTATLLRAEHRWICGAQTAQFHTEYDFGEDGGNIRTAYTNLTEVRKKS